MSTKGEVSKWTLCEMTFKKSGTRILTDLDARRELRHLRNARQAQSFNNVYSYFLLPATIVGAAAHNHYRPTQHVAYRQYAVAAAVALAVLTNLKASQARSKELDLTAECISKYMIDMDEKMINSYYKGHQFPKAK